ncbi:MAG TPA: transporter substrate-binding domain-containing protein [Telluria sp.]
MPTRTLALVLACACSAASATPSILITTDLPIPVGTQPHAASNSGLIGRMRDVATRAGVSYTIKQYPWKRAVATALAREDACVYATSRTPERESQFKWIGPLYERTWVLAGRAGQDYQVRTLEDARKYRIGTFLGDAGHEYLRSRGFNVDAAPDDSANAQKLLLGRIDLWVSATSSTGPEFLSYYPHAIVPVLPFNTVGLYLACNKAVPDTLVARMNAAAAAMLRNLEPVEPKVDTPSERRPRRPPCLLPGSPESRNNACD